MQRLPRLLTAACAVTALVPLLAVTTPTAAAPRTATPNTTRTPATPRAAKDCPADAFCFFYNSNEAGSHDTLHASVRDLAGYTFTSPGAGQGKPVKNNAASAVNNIDCTATVYYNSGYLGSHDQLDYRQARQLVNTYNQNASLKLTSCR